MRESLSDCQTSMYLIEWKETSARVRGPSDVEAELDRLDATFKKPTAVVVHHPSGNSMSIVLGLSGRSMLNFAFKDLEPPYFTSRGDGDPDELISYDFGGSLSELPASFFIDKNLARVAMSEFLKTGERASIEWALD